MRLGELTGGHHDSEVTGFALIGPDTRLGLPLHQDVARRYFENSAAGGRQVSLPDDEPHAV